MLDPFIGGGNVAYCTAQGKCHSAYDGDEPDEEALQPRASNLWTYQGLIELAAKYIPKPKLKIPNGLTRGADDLIYVPSSIDGNVRAFGLRADKTLQLLDTISVGVPIDNISPDANGDIYVAAFPNLRKVFESMDKPREIGSPVSIFRIRKLVRENAQGAVNVRYVVDKVLEDGEAKVLSGVTTVTHDAKTGRLFLGGKWPPFVSTKKTRKNLTLTLLQLFAVRTLWSATRSR